METIFRYVKTGGMEIPKFKFKVGDIVEYLPWHVKNFIVTGQDIYFNCYSIHKDYVTGGKHDVHGVKEEELRLMND